MRKELIKLNRTLKAQGAYLKPLRNGHYGVFLKSTGERVPRLAISATPSENRTGKNQRAALRQRGFNV